MSTEMNIRERDFEESDNNLRYVDKQLHPGDVVAAYVFLKNEYLLFGIGRMLGVYTRPYLHTDQVAEGQQPVQVAMILESWGEKSEGTDVWSDEVSFMEYGKFSLEFADGHKNGRPLSVASIHVYRECLAKLAKS